MDELTREFLIESQEGLTAWSAGLTIWRSGPGCGLIGEISVRCIPSREPPDSWVQAAGNVGPRRRNLLVNCARQADREPSIITGLLHLLDGLRSILKTIEADSIRRRGRGYRLDRPAGRVAGSGAGAGKNIRPCAGLAHFRARFFPQSPARAAGGA